LAQDTEIDEEEEEEKEGDQDMIQDVKGNTGDDSTNQLSKNNSNQTQKTWASIVNPTFPSLGNHDEQLISIQNKLHILQVGSNDKYTARNDDGSECGQFSDADEDTDPFFLATKAETTVDNDDDGDSSSKYGDSSVDISDEECDAYILDPEEAHERLQLLGKTLFQANTSSVDEQEFPSLINNSSKASSDDSYNHTGSNKLRKWEQIELEESERRKESLKPISANGKLYQSFHKYKDIISSTGINQKYLRHPNKLQGMHEEEKELPTLQNDFSSTSNFQSVNIQSMSTVSSHSRIIGGASMSGQGTQVEDDGEGWITCVKDIHSNSLSRVSDQRDSSSRDANSNNLPSRHQRTACATTDFAIQNVALQMNLELLTVDGVRVRKLKSWVSRCAACYTVYTGTENTRLFCGRCGASSLQRVAASVDGVTGRFRLHLKKNYKHNLRGTQYNLPAPGKGNKFMGDLLLREDQLLYGAWNQKLKKSMSPKSQSIFGADITSSLGYLTDLSKRDDIKVGFGGKNPNASKFGRERRGKKKKSTEDKACGLRRY
jgi:RNA-binding protein NOB1